jgi:hypothetical protein
MLTNLVEFDNLDTNDDVVEIHADVAASVTPLNLILFRGFFGFALLQVILDCMTRQVHFAGPWFLRVHVDASHFRRHDTTGPFCWTWWLEVDVHPTFFEIWGFVLVQVIFDCMTRGIHFTGHWFLGVLAAGERPSLRPWIRPWNRESRGGHFLRNWREYF